jgi:alanyl-tRNA synthetase
MPVDVVKEAIVPMRELYIVLDHTRTIMFTITDGALPSNVGGGGNVRNILRRVFSIMNRNGWWDKLGMSGFLEIFEQHKKDLEGIYGKFSEYKSFA